MMGDTCLVIDGGWMGSSCTYNARMISITGRSTRKTRVSTKGEALLPSIRSLALITSSFPSSVNHQSHRHCINPLGAITPTPNAIGHPCSSAVDLPFERDTFLMALYGETINHDTARLTFNFARSSVTCDLMWCVL